MSLLPCDGCGRHVRIATPRCPFCDAAISERAVPAPRVVPRSGVTRAVIFAGATLLVPACGGGAMYGGPPPDDGARMHSGEEDPPVDAPPDDAEPEAVEPPPPDESVEVPAYGGPSAS